MSMKAALSAQPSESTAMPQGGVRVHGLRSSNRRPRTSIIAALVNRRLVAPLLFEGTCNTEIFNALPCLPQGAVIVLDNTTFHKSIATKEIIRNARCTLLFLPPYSPDLNPIENNFATLKRRRKYHCNASLDQLIKMHK